MKFLYPEFLWALTVLAIPIVIHLFNFKRYKTLYFSSLQFIKHVDQQTKSTQKIKHFLVLLTRFFAFLFLVLAFAQPYFSDATKDLSSKSPIYCFYLDNSFSMQARGPEGELLSEAREKTKEIIQKSPADTRFIIGTNEMSGREERILSRREAFEKIDAITLSPLTRTLGQVTNWHQEILAKHFEEDAKTKVNYFLFTDFQKDATTPIKKTDFDITFYPTRLVPETTTNVYIDSVWFNAPIHKTGLNNTLSIKIQNDNKTAIENLEVTIRIEDYNKTIFVNAPAGKSVVTSVTYVDKTTGWKKGSINVADESVFFDDTYFISYEVLKFTNVLVINGEDAIDGTHVIYELNDAYTCSVKAITSLTASDFEGKDLVVINGANTMPSGIVSYLEAFSKTGGSVALFPGKTPDNAGWNQLLSTYKLPRIGNGISSGTRIKSLTYSDPFYSGVFEEKTPNVNLPGVSKTFRAIKSDTRSSDLILLQNGLPLLSYVKNKGSVYMFYSAIHEDFGAFSKDVLFTTVLLRMAELSKRPQPIALTIGQQTEYPIYENITGDQAFHVKGNKLDVIPQHNEISGVHYLSLNKLDNYQELLAGNYDITTDKILGAIGLNYDRAESKLRYLTEDQIAAIFGANTFKYNEISNSSELSTNDINKPFSYWKLCIVLTLIFVFSEMLLVRILK